MIRLKRQIIFSISVLCRYKPIKRLKEIKESKLKANLFLKDGLEVTLEDEVAQSQLMNTNRGNASWIEENDKIEVK